MPEPDRKRLLRGLLLKFWAAPWWFSQLPRHDTGRNWRKLIEYDEVGLAHLREAEKNSVASFSYGPLGAWELHSFVGRHLSIRSVSSFARSIIRASKKMIESVRTRLASPR